MSKKISGVYLEKGHEEEKNYCLVRQINDNEVEVRYLDEDDNPSELSETVSTAIFNQRFISPKYYFEGKIYKANQLLAKAEKYIDQNQLQEAKNELKNALELDPENLKANFEMGKLYLKTDETEKAKETFTNISKMDSIFEEKNKHFFNKCGIQLRKHQLYSEAIHFFKKALTLSPNDENLYFNLARTYFENRNPEKANKSILKSLKLNRDFREAKAYEEYMKKKGRDT